MSRAATIAVRSLLLVLVLAACVFVMRRVARMSLFLEARDRIEAGEPRDRVLSDLARWIHWEPAGPAAARDVAGDVRVGTAGLTVHRAGDWALLRGAVGELHLAERNRHGEWEPR